MSEVYNGNYWDLPMQVKRTFAKKNKNGIVYNDGYTWGIQERFDHSYTIQFPEEVNENTRIVIACGGAGGPTDSNSVLAANKGKNVIVIIPQLQNETDYRTVIKMSEELRDPNSDLSKQFAANGVNVASISQDSCVTFGAHSNSSKEVVNATLNYLTDERKDGKQTRAAVLINDAEHTQLIPNSSSIKKNFNDNKENLDDSLIFVTTQEYYLREDSQKGLVANRGYAPESYMSDLEAMAKAGATVMLTTYDIDPIGWTPYPPSDNWHTESVELTSVLGLCDLKSGVLDEGPVSFASARNGGKTLSAELAYYIFDTEKEQWVAFPTAVDAQRQLDISTAKVSLFNTGFLSKSDGKYTITLNGQSQEISKSDLEAYLAECKAAYKESDMSVTTFEEFMEEYSKTHLPGSPNKNDFVPPTLYDIGKACDALLDSLGDIGMHMQSFGTFRGLEVKPKGELSEYLQGMNAFPRGVSTSGLQASMECVNKLGSNLEDAYNATANLYDTFASVENQNGKYYPSSAYSKAGQSVATQVSNFAQDMK